MCPEEKTMEKNTKVQLTKKWWDDNKATTLKDKGKLGEALATFEKAQKLAAASKGSAKAKAMKAANAACEAMLKAADTNQKNCTKKIHDETQHILKNGFETAVETVQKDLKKSWEAMRTDLKNKKPAEVFKDRTLRVELHKQMKANFDLKHMDFIMSVSKRNMEVYDTFISRSSNTQVNVIRKTRDAFQQAAESGNIANAPWKKATEEVLTRIQQTYLGIQFANSLMGSAEL
jgi:hypothetical protein